MKEILDLFCCPETHQPLRTASADELAVANREDVVNRAGRKIPQHATDGFVREDGTILYPVWDGIPCLLIEEGIPLRPANSIS